MRTATRTSNGFVSLRGLIAMSFAVIALFASAPAVEAQVRDVEPYHVVVTNERVYLRCGAGGVWYAIGYANTGDVLQVDGEDFKWLRVEYPRTVRALVSVEEADYDAKRGVVVITRPSRLKAHNIHGQRFGDSWKNLLTQPLTPGTELKYVDSLRDVSGQIEGYLVDAPVGASAYISEEFTRRATPSEVEAHRAALRAQRQQAERPTVDQPAQVAQESKPESLETPSASTEPETEQSEVVATVAPTRETTPNPIDTPVEPKLNSDTSIADAPTITGDTLASTPAPTTETEPVAMPPAFVDNTPIEPESVTTPVATEVEADAAPTIDELESAFKALSIEPIESAEIQPLIAEYERLRDGIDDTEENRARRMRVENRIALLNVRLEVQENLRLLNETSESASAGAAAINTRLASLDATRPYALVGRLAASALYDGKRLPLMYRLQSVDNGSGRTIAYLAPNPDVDLRGKLGSIVGVEGPSRIDPALKLRIVQPTRVDLLTPTLSGVADTDQE